ncbi:hypothetical protein IG631_21055 [Alternaria alternata]|nr:hypothetical protein IG631_21055 [Alternaria alternata]
MVSGANAQFSVTKLLLLAATPLSSRKFPWSRRTTCLLALYTCQRWSRVGNYRCTRHDHILNTSVSHSHRAPLHHHAVS